MVDLTVIIPVFNESDNLTGFIKELNISLSRLNKSFEILAVNDGSTDNSLIVLKKLQNQYPKLKIFQLRKNYGKSVAYLIGFNKANGNICLTIDADGQDMPDQIPKLLALIQSGFPVVVGWRKYRQDSLFKKISSCLWNYLLKVFSGIDLHDVNCGLKAFQKNILKSEYFRGDFHRYLPVIIAMDGYKIAEVEVKHRPRIKGQSKYNVFRIFPAVFDFLTNMFLARYGYKPMHLFGPVGLFIFTLGMLINLYLLGIKLAGFPIGGRPLLTLGLLLTISGLQFLFTGFLGDLVIRNEDLNIEGYLDDKQKIII